MNKNPLLLDRLISLRLPAELEDKLRELAEEQGITQSELHRRSLAAMLDGIADFGKAERPPDDTEMTQ